MPPSLPSQPDKILSSLIKRSHKLKKGEPLLNVQSSPLSTFKHIETYSKEESTIPRPINK